MAAENITAILPVAVPVVPNLPFRVVVGTTCVLSALGSMLIILSYCCVKWLRSAARLILVHLSIMDLGVAVANLVGASLNFSTYYLIDGEYTVSGYPLLKHPSATIHALCNVQAAFAIYCTMGSLFWTNCMAVYIYLRIVHHITSRVSHTVLLLLTITCYLFPVLFVLWEWPLTHRLGYSPFSSAGWCGTRDIDLVMGHHHFLMVFVAYDMWILLTYIMVPVLYASVYLQIRVELQDLSIFVSSEKYWEAVHNLDYKLLLVPLAFLLLRVWSLVLSFVYIFLGKSLSPSAHLALTYLGGIGDSGQGVVNALLFVFFTKRVRQRLMQFSFCGRHPSWVKSLPQSVDTTGNVQNYYHTPTDPAASPKYYSHTGGTDDAYCSDDDSVY